MDWGHQLNESEIADALLGKSADERLASCEVCGKEFAAWAELGGKLRSDLAERADMPAYFWTRQQARIRDRLVPVRTALPWAAAAVLALTLLAFALATYGPGPNSELAQTIQPAPVQQVDPDNALLEDIQASLDREVPGPLMPAMVLVQEMAGNSRQSQQVKEN